MRYNPVVAPPPRKIYFISAGVDFTLIGGLSIAACAVFWGLNQAGTADPLPSLAFWLGWVCNWPHFSASTYRLYRTRDTIAQYPATALAVPLLLLFAVAGAFRSPDSVAPALVKLYFLWSPFHFSGQSFGITQLYARRAGVPLGPLFRYAFAGFFYATYANVVVAQDLDPSVIRFGGVFLPSLGLPAWLAIATNIAVALYGLLVLGAYAAASSASRKLLPPILLLPALAQFTWFVLGSRIPAFNVLVPFFHALQYLLIAWAMQLKERIDLTGATPSGAFLGSESLKWGLLNILGGALLFGALPRLAALAGVPFALSQPVLFAVLQIHHFFVDGVIWKLRNPRVGAPLLVSLEDLRGPVRVAGG